MAIRPRYVYALIVLSACVELGTLQGATSQRDSRAVSIDGQTVQPASVGPRCNDLWWALVRLSIEMLCVVLDCYMEDPPNPAANEDPEKIMDDMQAQILAYEGSGPKAGLTPSEIAQAQQAIADLTEALSEPPPEMDAGLGASYSAMLKNLSDDLANQ